MRLNKHLKLDDLYFHFIFKQVNPLYCIIQKALCFKSLENIQFRYLLTFITEYSMLNNHLLKDIALLILKKKKALSKLNKRRKSKDIIFRQKRWTFLKRILPGNLVSIHVLRSRANVLDLHNDFVSLLICMVGCELK